MVQAQFRNPQCLFSDFWSAPETCPLPFSARFLHKAFLPSVILIQPAWPLCTFFSLLKPSLSFSFPPFSLDALNSLLSPSGSSVCPLSLFPPSRLFPVPYTAVPYFTSLLPLIQLTTLVCSSPCIPIKWCPHLHRANNLGNVKNFWSRKPVLACSLEWVSCCWERWSKSLLSLLITFWAAVLGTSLQQAFLLCSFC